MIIDEELKPFMARDNLIEDILVYKERHAFEKVSLFLHKDYEIKNVSAAFALSEFLNENSIPCEVIASKPEKLKEIYKGTKRKATGKFLAVAIGCKEIGYIDPANYQDTFVLFQAYGPIKTKGYGVLNYTSNDVSCTAEIIFNQIYAFAKKNDLTISKNVAQHLYTALVAGTKRYGSNIKANTFVVAKVLLDLGADYKAANYFCEKKDPLVLQIQEMIFKTLVRKDRICYAFLKEKDLPEGTTMDILQDALSLFKKVDKIDVWILFSDRGYGYYNVVLQGKEINPFSLEIVARKNNGIGDKTTGQCSIRHNDVNKVLSEVEQLFEKNGFGYDETEEDEEDYDDSLENFDDEFENEAE